MMYIHAVECRVHHPYSTLLTQASICIFLCAERERERERERECFLLTNIALFSELVVIFFLMKWHQVKKKKGAISPQQHKSWGGTYRSLEKEKKIQLLS